MEAVLWGYLSGPGYTIHPEIITVGSSPGFTHVLKGLVSRPEPVGPCATFQSVSEK